ncbi:MAG: zf-HC2 domain-containing protein [Polyangiaceae bacterium]|nr:zf-HC2 domain-containing protein [Polyangiaceae bacterium]
MSPCRRMLPLLDAFGDGELSADQSLQVEQHLVDCGHCTERIRLNEAVRVSMKRAAPVPSAAFKARLCAALAAERQREEHPSERIGRPLSWRTIAPIAVAASVALAFAAARPKPDTMGAVAGAARASLMGHSPSSSSMQSNAASVTATVEQLIDELVTHHQQGSHPNVTEAALLEQLEPEVGVPVRLPSLYGARWEGASVLPVKAMRNQRAASLRYSVGGHRVTLYVYNSANVPLRATLEPRVVYNTPVYVGERRGYSIAAVERRGVGYAVATDLNDSESAELVVASLH